MVVSNRVTSRTTVLLHSRYLEPSEFSERGTFLKGLCIICQPVFKDDLSSSVMASGWSSVIGVMKKVQVSPVSATVRQMPDFFIHSH